MAEDVAENVTEELAEEMVSEVVADVDADVDGEEETAIGKEEAADVVGEGQSSYSMTSRRGSRRSFLRSSSFSIAGVYSTFSRSYMWRWYAAYISGMVGCGIALVSQYLSGRKREIIS